HRHAPGSEVQQGVHLVARRIAPEVELGGLAVMEEGLVELTNDEGLEDGSTQRVQVDVLRPAQPQEGAEEAGVEEVQLGRLHQPLVEILMVRLEEVEDIARLEHGDPVPRRRVADPGLACQGRAVYELPGTAGAEGQQVSATPTLS